MHALNHEAEMIARIDQGTIAHRHRMYDVLLKVHEYFVCLEDALGFKCSSQLRRDIHTLLESIQQFDITSESELSEGLNLRFFQRRLAEGTVVCQTNESAGQPIEGELANLSLVGALVAIPRELRVGTPIDMELLGSGEGVAVRSVVRRVEFHDDRHWIGCRFETPVPYTKIRHLFLQKDSLLEDVETAELSAEEIGAVIKRHLRQASTTRDPAKP